LSSSCVFLFASSLSSFFFFFVFFFSSRRRHTRSLRDWSSDVCSSDLSLVRFSTVRSPEEAPWWCTLALGSSRIVSPEIQARQDRSEEHTSELQSRRDLVCRLLLEKKKKKKKKKKKRKKIKNIHTR